MSDRAYSFDAKLRVWRTPAHESIAYSDGEPVENHLLAALQQSRDLSSTSSELRTHIVDWPSEYHLSPLRHALLRPFAITSSSRVLELGCGCGALTRYLGEMGATVVAVEGSALRAQIAAERCRDQPNVSIYCDNLAQFSSLERFDFVSLIGVLEYAPLFIRAPDPIGECLRIARSFLAEHGQLILAIENQLGLKYFNGCREDHTGERYSGVHDLYTDRQAITFGRRELVARLTEAGFARQDFAYPFPDYKLPTVILSSEGLLDPDVQAADMLCRTLSRDYAGPQLRSFHENLAWEALARNSLLADTANSFLVLASPIAVSDGGEPPERWLASTYSLDRKAAYALETRIVRRANSISVHKRHLLPESSTATSHAFFTHLPAEAAPHVAGRLYLCQLQRVLVRGGTLSELAAWARPWLETLHQRATTLGAGELLPADWLDAVPANFVLTGTGTLELIDVEWRAAEPVPLAWVIIRGLISAVSACPLPPALAGMSFRQMIDDSLRLLNYPLPDEQAYQRAAELEDLLAFTVYGPGRGVPPLRELLARSAFSYCSPPTMAEENRRLRDEIAAMQASRSWRLTAPLRAADNWLKKLTGS